MINKATLAGIILAGLVGLSGCTAKVGKYDANDDGYKMALADTSAVVDMAKKQGAEWRDIRWKKSKKNLFKQAASAAKDGDYEKAIKLLNKAKQHAELGMKQAESQKNAGPHS